MYRPKPRYSRNTRKRRPRVRRKAVTDLKKGRVINVKLTQTTNVTTDGSAKINDVFNLHNPALTIDGATAYDDWAAYSALYDQYRVRAIKIEYIPFYPNDEEAQFKHRPLVLVYDRDSSTALTTWDQAAGFSGRRWYSTHKRFTYYRKLHRIGPKDQDLTGGWIDCANPHSEGAIKTYSESMTASTSYGLWIMTAYCQFKNKI